MDLNRRVFALAAVGASVATLAGCDSDPKPSHTSTMLDNEKVHQAMTAVDEALSNLEGDVDNFDSESWRDVVPEIKSGTEDLREALDLLRTALGYPQ